MAMRYSTLCLLLALMIGQAHAAVGFGQRRTNDPSPSVGQDASSATSAETPIQTSQAAPAPVPVVTPAPAAAPVPVAATSPIATSAAAPATPATPATTEASSAPLRSVAPPSAPSGSEWLRVSFDKAESEVLALFERDLPKIEEFTQKVAVYEVRASGRLPQDYRRALRSKLERVVIASPRMQLIQCTTCEESRVYRDDKGEIRYESYSSDPGRATRIATELGAEHLLYTEMSYTPEDLELRVRVVDPRTGALRWAKEYSTADIVKTREGYNASGNPNELGHGDSLARVLIGEVAFTAVLSPGLGVLPTIKTGGKKAGLATYPSVDLFLGEKFDRGRKTFGFLIGGVMTMGDTGATSGKPLPWALRIAPRFRYNFNPYNVTTARYSIGGELGAMISSGMATGYVGLGPEISMINRFSVSLTPIYIVPTTIKGSEILVENGAGTLESKGNTDGGKYGGPGVIAKVSINW